MYCHFYIIIIIYHYLLLFIIIYYYTVFNIIHVLIHHLKRSVSYTVNASC